MFISFMELTEDLARKAGGGQVTEILKDYTELGLPSEE